MPTNRRVLTLLVFSLAAAGCAPRQQSDAVPDAQRQLTDQTVFAVNWMQQSGEASALSYQAFNSAEMAYDGAKPRSGLKKAVVVDLDETMIDNTPYAGWQIKQHQPFTDATWSRWTQARQAKALPGAVAFSHYVVDRGGQIFYVSNRDQRDYGATLDNLKALGFANAGAETLLLKPAGGSSNKAARFAEVEQRGYDIVVYVGDNLNDFSGDTYHQLNTQRRNFVNQHQQDFGRRYILLPNPSYGDWESGMAKGYNAASDQQKLDIRASRIDAWDGR